MNNFKFKVGDIVCTKYGRGQILATTSRQRLTYNVVYSLNSNITQCFCDIYEYEITLHTPICPEYMKNEKV